MIRLIEEQGQTRFELLVQPRAGGNRVVGELDGALKIRIAAAPVEGRANVECVRYLAKILGVRRADIDIVSGATARRKLISVRGVRAAALAERLAAILTSGTKER